MCRWLAYSGPSLFLDELVIRPRHSLRSQSLHARESTFQVNADGFGLGWYSRRETPGVYHDTHPAWNDQNLGSIAAHIQSKLFFAHIRAAVGSPVTQSNCHPFRHGKWLFQHNGAIGQFGRLKHRLDMLIDQDLYADKVGQTDSETMFLLSLTFGLGSDPFGGICRMIEAVERARDQESISDPFRMTIAATDGEAIYAARYASHGDPPSLYHSTSGATLLADGEALVEIPDSGFLILSEPLDDLAENWVEIPASSQLVIEPGSAKAGPLFSG